MKTLTGKILWLDFETTGLEHTKAGLTQVGAMMEINGEPVDEFQTLIRPHAEAEISEEALAVTGHTLTQLEQDGIPDAEAYLRFRNWITKHINPYDKVDKATLGGYNVGFDNGFMLSWARRNADKFIGSLVHSRGFIDVMCIASVALLDRKTKMPSFKLGEVAKEILGVAEFEKFLSGRNLHDAMTDIHLTREVFHRSLSQIGGLFHG